MINLKLLKNHEESFIEPFLKERKYDLIDEV